jgi:DNA-binding HxlR family transcriptional regulator
MKSVAKQKPCAVTVVAVILLYTWTILIVHNLLSTKAVRFCELERVLEGISTRTLTVKLKKLEDEQLVLKTDAGYTLTKTGRKLQPVLKAMEQFGKSLS